MAFLETLGELTGFSTSKKAWTLKNDDDGSVIRGQYVPVDYTENIGVNLKDSSTVNQQQPFSQWISGEAETVTFSARVFATNSFKQVRDDIDKLKAATRKPENPLDPLKRAPIFTFTWGVDIAFKCFVVGLGGIKYDEVRSDGTIRGANFQITLRKLEEIPTFATGVSLAAKIKLAAGAAVAVAGIADVTGLINIPGGSLHKIGRTKVAKDGDTFESIAAKEYGSAAVGDILRRTQPDKARLKPGDQVILVDPVEIFEIEIKPQSPALRQDSTAQSVREKKFAQRNRPTVKVL